MILNKKKLLKSLKKHEHHARGRRHQVDKGSPNYHYWSGREDALRTMRIKIKRGTQDDE